MLWDVKFQQLSRELKLPKADLEPKVKNNEMGSPERPKRRRTVSRSRTKSGSERSMSESDTDSDIAKNERKRRISGGGKPVKHTTPNKQVIGSIAVNSPVQLNGPDVLNGDRDMSAELKKELISFVHEKLVYRNVLGITDLRRLFTLKLAELPPGHLLSSGISDKQLEQAVLEVGGVAIQGEHQTLFVLAKRGDSYDSMRVTLVEMFKTGRSVRSNVYRKKLEEMTGIPPQESEVKKVLKDYCIPKGGLWYLKGSIGDT